MGSQAPLKSCTFLTASVLAIARQGMVDCVHTDPALSSQAHSVKPPPVPQQAMDDIKQSGTEPDSFSTTLLEVGPKPHSKTPPAKAFKQVLAMLKSFASCWRANWLPSPGLSIVAARPLSHTRPMALSFFVSSKPYEPEPKFWSSPRRVFQERCAFWRHVMLVEPLCELLARELLVVGWPVDSLSGTTCPHTPNGTLVLGKFDAIRLCAERSSCNHHARSSSVLRVLESRNALWV